MLAIKQLGQRIPACAAGRPDLRQRRFLQLGIAHQRDLPAQARTGNPQYIGFFHTGAYQESIGGFWRHPAPSDSGPPKHVIIDRDKDDNEYYTRLFAKEQSYRSMLRILGY